MERLKGHANQIRENETPYQSLVAVFHSRHKKNKTYSEDVDLRLHPTQKPIKVLEYLIETYTDENGIILDNCMGSGSTGIACLNTNRRFIGIELDENYYNIAKERIHNAKQ